MTGPAEVTPSGDTARSRNHRDGRIVVVLLIVAMLGAAAYFGYGAYSTKRLASNRLAKATSAIEEADRLVARIDAVVGAKVESGLETRTADALVETDEARTLLGEAVQTLDSIKLKLAVSDRERADALRAAADARIGMLEQVPTILNASAKAARALPKAEQAWAHVTEAGKLSEQAVAEYNKLTTKGVKASSRLNKTAAGELSAAREGFVAAEAAFPESQLEVYISYVDARIAANKVSRRSDSAWLSGDIAQANQLIGTYNVLDRRSVAQGKTLPSSPASVIADAYATATKAASDAYYSARERATEADAKAKRL